MKSAHHFSIGLSRWSTLRWLLLSGLALAVLLALSSCGVTAGSSLAGASQSTVTPGSNLTPSTTATHSANGAAHVGNCPTAEQPADAALPPTTIIVPSATSQFDPSMPDASQLVAVKVGQSIEFRMPSSLHWDMSLRDGRGALQAQGDAGWYDAAHKTCNWRFLALSTGSPEILFAGMAGCKPPEMCPDFIITWRYDLAITAG